MLDAKHILVVGAGIGGLAAARALALRGARVTLIEQAPAITEVGAGIQLSPNGFSVLRGLGLDGAMRASGAINARGIVLRNPAGRQVSRVDLSALARPADYLFVHRADIIDILADGARAAGVDIRLSTQARSVADGPRPALTTTTGEVITADLIIGADGLHSVVRTQLNGAATPRFTGHVAWRAVVPETGTRAEADLYLGPGRHIVTYPLRDFRQRNIVAVEERKAWAPESWSYRDDPANLRAAFTMMGAPVRELLARVDDVHMWGLFRHPVASHWHGEGLAILGDAAHPTLPFMAQGACMALEDAWVLAEAMDTERSVPDALARYQASRRDRAARIVGVANANARKYHLRPPLAGLSHIVLGAVDRLAPNLMLGSFGWLYGYDVTGGATLQASRSTQTGT